MTQQSRDKDKDAKPDQCRHALGHGLGYYTQCSLDEGHPAHHIAFGENTDLQAATWPRNSVQETIIPEPGIPTPKERNKKWADKAREGSMKKLALLLGLLLLPSVAMAVPTIVFDTTPGGAGGSITYDGAGGPAVGTNIQFVDIVGGDTPLNNGVVLGCVDCFLSFVTGANTQEGPPGWSWLGGGTISLIGDVPALGLDDAVLLSGSFTGTPNTPGLIGGDAGAFFLGIGVDTKNPVLAGFYGVPAENWVFANSEIALGTFTFDPATSAFSATPNQADIIDASIPEPGTLLLLGTGLLAIGWRRGRG